jgi:16S rRNA processing protein RimM
LSSSTDRTEVGRIGRPHGLRGEVTVVADEQSWFAPGAEFDLDRGGTLRVRSARPHRDRGLLVAFEGVADRAGAEGLRGAVLLAAAPGRHDLGPGAWWPEQLVGLQAVRPSGEALGEVGGVVVGDAQDRLVITTPDGRTVEVPFVDELVDDPEGGRIVVRPPAGLFDRPGFPVGGRDAPD